MRAASTFAALTVLASLASYTYAQKCKCNCTFKYDPVCAADSKGIEETYPNECSFECYKCTHNKNLLIRSRGECTNKSPGLPSGRRERQKTAAGNSNAQRTSTTKCNCKCPFNYSPLCAVDSKGVAETYSNQCVFECYKCTHGKDLRVRSVGECQSYGRPTPGTVQKPQPNDKCNCKCTFEYAPVCARDSKGIQETYPSKCAFECYKCTHGKDLRIFKQGECSEKNIPNRPSIPTGNGGNKNQTGRCNCKCTFIYTPVCAVDSRGIEETYPSSCSFECYKCTHGKELRILKQGECSSKATARPPKPGPLSRTGQNYNPKPTINKNCDCICGLDYSPLCAVNSKGDEQTFPNRCALDCRNCKFNEDFVLRRTGECGGRTPQLPPRSKTRTA